MLHFLRLHAYTLLVTALVLALSAGSLHLRHMRSQPRAVSAAPVVTAAPVIVASPAPTQEPVRTWQRPVSGGVLTAYSDSPRFNADMDCWEVHAGIDLAAKADEPVRAAAAGRVISVVQDILLGTMVVLDHGEGYETRYASLTSAKCAPEQYLQAGDILGITGDTADSEALLGCHLHFELLRDGSPLRPIFD